MALTQRTKDSVSPWCQKPGGRGNTYTGIYVGIVKDNRDIHRMGRLLVFVPELGGDPDDDSSWSICAYASPFAGSTPVKFIEKDIKTYENTQTSYGWWAVSPDVESKVLVAFAGGDITRGVWFGCLYDQFMNQAVPGHASLGDSLHYGKDLVTDQCSLPTTEYNKIVTDERSGIVIPDNEKKPVHPYFAAGLTNQGLIYDKVRGITTASARREAPSMVFGLNTPGPLVPEEEGGRMDYPYKAERTGKNDERLPINRKGGHQFVLDDHPEHEHIKLRTRSGAEIILDETNGMVYITNRDSSAWIELSESGHVDVYAKNSVSVRSERDINLRADRDMNIEAGRNINIKAAKDYIEDRDLFISGYTDRDGNSILSPEVFTDKEKLELVEDVQSVWEKYLNGQSVRASFIEALSTFGITSVPGSKANQTTDYKAHGNLSSVELMDIIRGSHILGEGFGDGGNIKIHAKNNADFNTGQNFKLTAESGNLDVFTGLNTKLTTGTSLETLVGTHTTLTTGTYLDIISGSDSTYTVGGNYNMSVLQDTNMLYRQDVTILLEGDNLKIEAEPVSFNDEGREVTGSVHNSIINLGNLDLSSETTKYTITDTFDLKVSSTWTAEASEIGIKSSNFNLETGGNVQFSGTLRADGAISSGGDIVSSQQSLDALFEHIHPDVEPGGGVTGPFGAAGSQTSATGPEATEATENEFYASFPDGVPWPIRASTSKVAEIASVPGLYAKRNVLPTLERDGNKVYDLAYYTQVIETIVKRFMTHEPCPEHENNGNITDSNKIDSDYHIYRDLS